MWIRFQNTINGEGWSALSSTVCLDLIWCFKGKLVAIEDFVDFQGECIGRLILLLVCCYHYFIFCFYLLSLSLIVKS